MINTLRKKLKNKEISPEELFIYFHNKIKTGDKDINSFITLSDIHKQFSKDLPLSGIPVAVKDNIITKNIRTTCASRMLADFVPSYNAEAVYRLYSSGASVIGKNNMDEFSMGSSSKNSYFGPVRNPKNIKKDPGGSSGGSAAAVASGFCAAALGSDTGGSVRLPASFCGVYGMKPTYGSVSRYGLISFASSLDQIGVIANSPHDIGTVLNIISGYDEKDMTSSKIKTDFLSCRDISLFGLNIGISDEILKYTEDDEIKNALHSMIVFFERSGAKTVKIPPLSLMDSVRAYYIISSAEASANLSRYDGIRYGLSGGKKCGFFEDISSVRSDGFGDEVKKRILFGNHVLYGENYEKLYKPAVSERKKLVRRYEDVFSSCDILISPAFPRIVPDTGEETKPFENKYFSDLFTVGANLAALPSICVPFGTDKNGMPIGLCLTGRRFSDPLLIGAGIVIHHQFNDKEFVI